MPFYMTFFGEFANSHAHIFTYPSIIVDIEEIVNPVCQGKRLMEESVSMDGFSTTCFLACIESVDIGLVQLS